MSKGVNKVILLGHVGQDPEIRYMPNGGAVANFSLATSESWKGKDGQQQERTEWHKIVIYRKLAEIVKQYVKKGSKLYLEGKVQTRKWQDQSGQDRYTTEIVCNEMKILDSRGSTGNGQKQPENRYEASAAFQGGSSEQFDDEIPF